MTSASRIPTRTTHPPQPKRMLMRKYSSSTSSSSSCIATTGANTPSTTSHTPPTFTDPDIGIDDSDDDNDAMDEDESHPYNHRTITAKPNNSHAQQHHHHHPSRQQQQPTDEHKERILSPLPASSPSRRSVSVTRDDSLPDVASASLLSSYDPSVLSNVVALQTQLQQKDSELQQLSEALLLIQSSPTTTTSTSTPPSTTSALVKDLMRQKRDLHLQLTRERQQHSQQLKEARSTLLDEQQQQQQSTQCVECDRLKEEMSAMTGRLNGAKAAVREWQRKCEKLESVLVRECGGTEELNEAMRDKSEEKEANDSSISISSGSGSGWKGRAERVRELEKKLSTLQNKLKDQNSLLTNLQQNNINNNNKHNSTTAIDQAAVERKRDEAQRKELEDRERQLSELKDNKRVQAARVRTLEVEVGEMKQRLMVMIGKSEMDDTLIDRLKAERKEREAVKDANDTRWQQQQHSWQERQQQLQAQLAEWQHKWQHGQHWQAAIDTLTATTAVNQASEWNIERDTLHSLVTQLQQRCDQLTVDKLTAQRNNEADAKRAAKARLSLPKAAPAAATGGGRVGGVVSEEERRRMADTVGERELIREQYAAMLERKEEELEQWKEMRAREKEAEQKTRDELKSQVVALIRNMQQTQVIQE